MCPATRLNEVCFTLRHASVTCIALSKCILGPSVQTPTREAHPSTDAWSVEQAYRPVFPAGFFSAAVVWSPNPLGGSGGMAPRPECFCTLYIGMHVSGAL